MIQQLFSGGGKSNLLGVDLTPESISIVEIKQQGANLKLANYASTPMPAGSMEEGKIIDPMAVGSALRQLLGDSRIKQASVAGAIPGREAIVRLLRLPPDLQEDELRDTVLNQEAELYIPFPRDEADIDYQPLGIQVTPEGTEEMEVLLVAIPRDIVDNYVEVLSSAGLQAESIELSSFATIRAIKDQLVQFGPQEAIALVSIGYESTEISIIVSGIPQFTRTIGIGTAQMHQVLGEALNVPSSSADSLLKSLKLPLVDTEFGDRQAGNPGSAAVARVLVDLADELQRSIDFYANQDGSSAVVQILLSGSGASLGDIDVFMSQQLSQTVVLANPFSSINIPASLNIADAEKPSLGVAVGLGLREN
ncbi:MAG: type IV pilus assembly protein PilM [Cyanobacteria bacterium P01_G01_bin.4]